MTEERVTQREWPAVGRPLMPADYGVPETDEGVLEWSWATMRLEVARNYWFSTTRPDGRPHSVPAWGAWIDGALYFEGSAETRRARNIEGQPYVVIHLESGDEVMILEGEAHAAGRPERALAERLSAVFTSKYGVSHDYRPAPTQWDEGGLWVMRPSVAFGWSEFPGNVTRWRFAAS